MFLANAFRINLYSIIPPTWYKLFFLVFQLVNFQTCAGSALYPPIKVFKNGEIPSKMSTEIITLVESETPKSWTFEKATEQHHH